MQVTNFMKNEITGSSFSRVLEKVISELPETEKKSLPLGIVMLEADGAISAVNVPITDDNVQDVTSSMFAIEYILYAFDRFDWMEQYVRSLESEKQAHTASEIEKKRSKFRLIPGGKSDEEG